MDRTRARHNKLFQCLFFFIAPFFLMAAAPLDMTELSLEELMEIRVVGASKFEQRVTNAPAAVTLVTADDIQKFGYRTLADLLRSVRGFSITYDRNYWYAGIRGFGSTGDYNSRILIQIDGHRLNDNIYNSSFIGTEFILDLDLIDRVEIIRGSGSSLYGSNAFFGVINIITKKTTDFGQPGAAVAYASYDTLKGRLSYGRQFDSGVDLAVSGSGFYSDGQDLYFPEFDDPATNNGLARDSDDDRSRNLFGRLKYGYFTLETAWMSRDKTLPTAPYDTEFNNPDTDTVDEDWYLDLNYHRTVLHGTDVTARLFYDEYRYEGHYIYNGLTNRDTALGQYWGSELTVSRPFLEETHRLTMGAEFIDNIKQHQANEDVYPYVSYLDSTESNQKWGIYLQDEYRAASWLLINAGLREDHYPTFGDTVNPRLAVIIQPRESTTLKLIYGTAFRAPNTYELYYADGSSAQRPAHLDPEKITAYEAVLEQRLFSNYRITITGFTYRIEDLIRQVTDPETELSVFQNLDEVKTNGIELELEGVWGNGLRGNISYVFQDARDDLTGKRLVNCPRHIGKLNMVVPLFRKNWFLGTGIQYLSPRKTRDDSETSAVWLADMTLLCRNILWGMDLTLSGFNLLDENYKDPAGLEFRQNAIEQDGLNFLIKLAYSFGRK